MFSIFYHENNIESIDLLTMLLKYTNCPFIDRSSTTTMQHNIINDSTGIALQHNEFNNKKENKT